MAGDCSIRPDLIGTAVLPRDHSAGYHDRQRALRLPRDKATVRGACHPVSEECLELKLGLLQIWWESNGSGAISSLSR